MARTKKQLADLMRKADEAFDRADQDRARSRENTKEKLRLAEVLKKQRMDIADAKRRR